MKFCNNCGFKLESNVNFCTNCGQKLDKAIQTDSVADSPQPIEDKKIVKIKPINIILLIVLILLIVTLGVLTILSDSSQNPIQSITKLFDKETDSSSDNNENQNINEDDNAISVDQLNNTNERGNAGNIVNGGLVAQQGN